MVDDDDEEEEDQKRPGASRRRPGVPGEELEGETCCSAATSGLTFLGCQEGFPTEPS